MHRNMSQQRDISDRRRPLTDYRAELKSPYCRPSANQYDQDKRMRREIANSNERRRMQSINNGFTVLRKKLPNQHGEEKLSKANILQQTYEYINKLEDEIRSLTNQMKSPQSYRGPEGQPSRKRKNFDRNGGLREEDLCSTLIDEKLQLQYRLDEETEKCKKLMRRINELEKVMAAQSYNKTMSIAPGLEVRTVSSAGKSSQKQHHTTQKLANRLSTATATPILSVSGVPSAATPTSITTATKSTKATATSTSTTESVVSSQSATVIRLRDSPEPSAKRLHGIHQLILAADHVENEHQVRTVSRVEPKIVSATGSVLVSKQQQQQQQTDQISASASTGKSPHLQVLQLMTTSQAEGGSVKTTSGSSSTVAGVTVAGTPTHSSVSQRVSSTTGGSSPAATSQLIQIVPAGQDIPASTHVLHLVTGQSQRPRASKVSTIQEQKVGPTTATTTAPQPAVTPQQVLRIVPQVRVQTGGTGATAVKVEPNPATANVLTVDQSNTKLGDIGQQFTLFMRRQPTTSSAGQPILGTAVTVSTSTSAPTPTLSQAGSNSTPTSQSLSAQVLDPPSS